MCESAGTSAGEWNSNALPSPPSGAVKVIDGGGSDALKADEHAALSVGTAPPVFLYVYFIPFPLNN